MFAISLLLSTLILPVSVQAHSGGLDSRGGHYCHTDCAMYGLDTGQYHFHPDEMEKEQMQRYTRLRSSLCARVFAQYSSNIRILERVQQRIQQRLGFRCEHDTAASPDSIEEDTDRHGYGVQRSETDISSRGLFESVQVLKVVDGDTFDVRLPGGQYETVRIIGIDTPEVRGFGRILNECYGPEASYYAKRLLSRKGVETEGKEGEDGRDVYGRLLRYVDLDGLDVGLHFIEEGYARNYPWFDHPRKELYTAAEERAKSSKKGLWSVCDE